MINRLCRSALVGLGVLLACLSAPAHAQSNPKTITMVVPYAALYTCAIGLVDFLLRGLTIPYRMVICVAAAVISMIWMIWMTGTLDEPAKLASICLMAALSAALCSWLCDAFANRKSPPAGLMPAAVSTASPG